MRTSSEMTATMSRTARYVAGHLESWRGETHTKPNPDRPGRPSVFTDADLTSQRTIVRMMREACPEAQFILEETDIETPIFAPQSMEGFPEWTVCADPIDGSRNFIHRLGGHAVSIGALHRGKMICGAVSAPLFCGGWHAAGDLTMSHLLEGDQMHVMEVAPDKSIGDRVILFGNDLLKKPEFHPFVMQASLVTPLHMIPHSCALGMAIVAAGRADVLIQPHQGPWDFAGGYPLVIGAGGAVQFFHYRDKKLVWMDDPDLMTWQDQQHRNTGFIAGNPSAVEWAKDLLTKKFLPS